MIETKRLKKVFKSADIETVALAGIDLKVEEADFVSVMGPSGCGKTTLLNLLGMIDVASSGSYRFKGEEVYSLTEKQITRLRKQNIGFVFQNFNLIEELSIWENIELPLIYQGVKKAERKRRVMEVIDRLEISHRKDLLPVQLSGGQQQRVAVARAIVTRSEEHTSELQSH